MINKFIISLVLTLTMLASSQAEETMQAHAEIAAAVTDYITHTINLSGEFEVELVPIDNRLQLPACKKPLETFSPTGAIKAGRNSIGVRCHGEQQWSIFTTALVKVFQPVLVLSQPLRRGETITRQHYFQETRDVSKLHDDFIIEVAQIENKQTTRQLPAGIILSPRYFAEPKLIKRGEKVVISANREVFEIKMDGLAMMDGIRGERVRIKNESSRRIINATVIAPGLVTVN